MSLEIQKKVQLWPIWKIKWACDILFIHQGVTLIIELLQLDRIQVFIYSVWSKCLKLLSTVDFSRDEWKKFIGPLQSSLFPWCVMMPGIPPMYIIPVHSRNSQGIVQTWQQRCHRSHRCRAAPPPAQLMALSRKQPHGTGGLSGQSGGCLLEKKEIKKSQQTNKPELKRNASIAVGNMSPAPHWNYPDRLSYLCPRHPTCLDSQEDGWICYPNIEWRSSPLCCDTDQSTQLLLDISRTWWRERWADLPGYMPIDNSCCIFAAAWTVSFSCSLLLQSWLLSCCFLLLESRPCIVLMGVFRKGESASLFLQRR